MGLPKAGGNGGDLFQKAGRDKGDINFGHVKSNLFTVLGMLVVLFCQLNSYMTGVGLIDDVWLISGGLQRASRFSANTTRMS